MVSMDNQYVNLARHKFVQCSKQGVELDSQTRIHYEQEFMDLLARTTPVTETEKTIAATFRWIASRNRSSFIAEMFAGRYACASLLVDDSMAKIGLDIKGVSSISLNTNGRRGGDFRPLLEQRESGSRRRDRKNRNHGRLPSKADSNPGRMSGDKRRRSAPVLNDATYRSILDDLSNNAKSPDDTAKELKITNNRGSYIDAVMGRTSSASKGDASPSSKDDASPSSKNDASPSSKDDTPLASKGDASPSSKNDASPSSKDDTPLASKGDASPSSKDDASPSSKGDTSPSSKDDASPSSKDDTDVDSRMTFLSPSIPDGIDWADVETDDTWVES